jgi:hypothetical protein
MSTPTLQDYTVEQIAEFFVYLDDLRESAVTNMYGATSYLRIEFGMDRRLSEAVLKAWMHQPLATSAIDRATAALAAVQKG